MTDKPAPQPTGRAMTMREIREALGHNVTGPAPATDRNALSDVERQFLTYALDLAADQMASRGDEFSDEDHSAMDRLRRLAGEAQQDEAREAIARVRSVVHIADDEDVTDWQRGFRACSVVVLDALANPAREAQQDTTQDGTRRCVCGDPIQLMDEGDPTSWIHTPGSDTDCLEARPRR